ncbi:hypothetical protein JCM5350_005595, partial [Sporobolomyces pararoseus]
KKEKKGKKEKPKEKLLIPSTDWIRVVTNKGNVFYNNSKTKESVWNVPEEIKDLVEELLKEKEKEKEVEEKETDRLKQRKRKVEEDEDNEDETEGDHREDDAKEEEEVEKGNLEIEIEGTHENGKPSQVPTLEPKPTSPTSTATTKTKDEQQQEQQPPKKKKPKTKIVSSIEELETEEDWQRQMAEQMAKEVEQAEEREKKEFEQAMKPDSPPPAEKEKEEEKEKLEVNQIEAAALYKVLLEEKDINPMAPFENELPKFVNDPRYHAVKSQRDRRDIFDEFCKEKIRERRAAKAKLAQSGIKVDPLEAYRSLLSSTVTSTRTHFSDFKKAHGKDPRFREFGKNEGEKEKEFKKYLRDLGEKKRLAAEKAEKEFGEMLNQDLEITKGDKWIDVKKRHSSDPRYAAVNSSSLREQLFKNHLSSLSSSSRPTASTSTSTSTATDSSTKTTPSKEDRAARAAASLKEREEKVRLEKEKIERNAQQARGNLGKEEAEREFGQLLIDAVRDHKAHFEDVSPNLSQDPRFDHPSLTPRDKRKLFDQHLSNLHRKRVVAVESLFSEHSPALDTPFHQVLPRISDSPQVTRLFGDDFNSLENLYNSWQSKRSVQAK